KDRVLPDIRHEWALTAVATTGLFLGIRRWVTAGRRHLGAGLVADRVRRRTRDRAQAELIVNQHGRTPLDYFKLWPDKSYYFSSSRQSVVAYRVGCSVAVSLGDPVGPVAELEPLIQSFLRSCADHGRRAAFHQVLPDFLPVYLPQGLYGIEL